MTPSLMSHSQPINPVPPAQQQQQDKPRVVGIPKQGPYTIFAPTDSAFEQMLQARLRSRVCVWLPNA